jgi:anti-anti-sigma regulatory factor
MSESGGIIVVADAARPEWARLVLRGRVGISSASRLREAALEAAAGEKNVSVCCAEIESLDLAAIQVLLCLGRELASRGKQCDVANVPDAIGRLFRLAGLGTA